MYLLTQSRPPGGAVAGSGAGAGVSGRPWRLFVQHRPGSGARRARCSSARALIENFLSHLWIQSISSVFQNNHGKGSRSSQSAVQMEWCLATGPGYPRWLFCRESVTKCLGKFPVDFDGAGKGGIESGRRFRVLGINCVGSVSYSPGHGSGMRTLSGS